jgi:hypothetical protein
MERLEDDAFDMSDLYYHTLVTEVYFPLWDTREYTCLVGS